MGSPAQPSSPIASGDVDNGSSNRRRIEIDYNDVGLTAGLPRSVFCKVAQTLDSRMLLGISGAAHAESTFFGPPHDMVDVNVPRSYLSNYDRHSSRSILLLEDLTGQAELCDVYTKIDRNRAEGQIDLLAKFHAFFYDRPDLGKAPLDFITWPQWSANLETLGFHTATDNGFRAAEEVIPERLFKRADDIWGLTGLSTEQHDKHPQTLIHSDVHLGNWYVSTNERMGLLDWQAVCRGLCARDLAYVISAGLEIEDRRNWEHELLRRYIAALEENGGPTIGFDDALLHYRQQLFQPLAFWTITLTPSDDIPDMQGQDISLKNIERIAAAVDDNDSVSAFD